MIAILLIIFTTLTMYISFETINIFEEKARVPIPELIQEVGKDYAIQITTEVSWLIKKLGLLFFAIGVVNGILIVLTLLVIHKFLKRS